MTRFISAACMILMLIFVADAALAQSKPKKKASMVKDEEVVPPPPPKEPFQSPTQIDPADIPISFDTTAVPQDELTQEITHLLNVTGAINLGKQFAQSMANTQKNSTANKLPQEFYDRMMEEFEHGQTGKWMVNSIIRIYRENFTIEEIKTISAFYQTPVGKKTISILPAVMQQSIKEGEKIGGYLGLKTYYQLVKEGKIQQ
jgi:uncharacterized protein